MAIFLLLIVVIILVGASTSFGAMGIVVGLFADVLALVYFFGMTVQVFLIGWVAFMAGLLVFTLVSTSATHKPKLLMLPHFLRRAVGLGVRM